MTPIDYVRRLCCNLGGARRMKLWTGTALLATLGATEEREPEPGSKAADRLRQAPHRGGEPRRRGVQEFNRVWQTGALLHATVHSAVPEPRRALIVRTR